MSECFHVVCMLKNIWKVCVVYVWLMAITHIWICWMIGGSGRGGYGDNDDDDDDDAV